MVVTQNEFDEWLQHPITVAFKKALFNEREIIKEGIVQDRFDSEWEAKGTAKAIQKILIMDYEDLIQSIKGED